MPGYFFDTSALVKHYHPEAGSAEVDRLWNDPLQSLFASRLSALEIVSAFAGKVRAGAISTPIQTTLLSDEIMVEYLNCWRILCLSVPG
jgi:predicted nucleic acid-binding protein